MKLLITGATGFIGKHLVQALTNSEHHVTCLVRKTSNVDGIPKGRNILIEKVDFENEFILGNFFQKADTVIHLAGQMGGYGIPYETFYHTNCELTETLLKISKDAGVKHFIYCSTPGVLGFGKRLASEEEKYAPRNPYEKTKVIAEHFIKDFCEKNPDLHYTIIRPDFVYGPGDIRRVKMYKNIKRKKFILTTSGKSHLHPTYIDDVVSGFLCCLGNEKSYNDTFNIAAENDVTVKQYLDIIAQQVGSKLIQVNIGISLSRILAGIIDNLFRIFLHREGFVSKNKIDFLAMDHSSAITHAKETIGYTPIYTCEAGIQKTIEWCEKEKLL